MDKIIINEPNIAEIGDTVVCVLKHVESYCERVTPNKVFEKGNLVDYTGPKMFTQCIRVYVILSNGSSFETKENINLLDGEQSQFPKKGFFEKVYAEWKPITSEEFYKKLIIV